MLVFIVVQCSMESINIEAGDEYDLLIDRCRYALRDVGVQTLLTVL